MDRDYILPFPGPKQPSTPGSKPNQSHSPYVVSIDRVLYRTAQSREDFSGAFQLLQRRYANAGLASSSDVTMRVLPYHLWSETQVFVAVHRNKVVGSVSLIRDSIRNGLPMETTYCEAVADLRREGSRIGEVCSLSVDSPGNLSSGELFGQLTRLMTFHARQIGLDCLLAVVHPRHAKFYQMAMGFEEIGGMAPCNHVRGQPGIPVLGRINDRLGCRARWYRRYFEGTYSDAELKPRPMSQPDREFFRQYLPQDHSVRAKRSA